MRPRAVSAVATTILRMWRIMARARHVPPPSPWEDLRPMRPLVTDPTVPSGTPVHPSVTPWRIARLAGRAAAALLSAALALAAMPGIAPSATASPPATASPDQAAALSALAAVDVSALNPAAAVADGGATAQLPTALVPVRASGPSVAAAAALTVSFRTVVSGLKSPVAVAAPNDGSGRLFVVEQSGRIRIVKGTTLLSTPYLDIHTKVSCCGERGLLGLAFHPQFAINHRFFVFYTTTSGNLQVSEFRQSSTNRNRAITTERKILTIGHTTFANHNGGQLAFGPDGYLYIGTGDGGGAGNPLGTGQSRTTLLGKILRININGSTSTRHYLIPSTNPYARSTVFRHEIWSYGLRNPWRFSFDRVTGNLWIGDVGQDRFEEIDRALHSAGGGRGVNYGWNVLEGRSCFMPATGCSTAGKTMPVAVYSHAGGSCAVIGGFVYRGSAFAALRGKYFLADFCSGKVWTLSGVSSSAGSLHLVADVGFSISSFGQGPTGELYVTDYTNGRLLRLRTP